MKPMRARNVRQSYYSILGLQVPPVLSDSSESLFQSSHIDIQKLKRITLDYEIPKGKRPIIWKVLLGVLPPFRESWEYVEQQQREQFECLSSATSLLTQKLSASSSSSSFQSLSSPPLAEPSEEEQILQMASKITRVFKVENYVDDRFSKDHSIIANKLVDIARVFCMIFDNESDAFWSFKKFITNRSQMVSSDKKMIDMMNQALMVFLKTEAPELLGHLKLIGIELEEIATIWFSSYFASALPFSSLVRLWDKLVSSSDQMYIVMFAAVLLLEMKPLLSVKPPLSDSEARLLLLKIPLTVDLHHILQQVDSPKLQHLPSKSHRTL